MVNLIYGLAKGIVEVETSQQRGQQHQHVLLCEPAKRVTRSKHLSLCSIPKLYVNTRIDENCTALVRGIVAISLLMYSYNKLNGDVEFTIHLVQNR